MEGWLGFIRAYWHCSHGPSGRGPRRCNVSRRDAARLVAAGLTTPVLSLWPGESKATEQGTLKTPSFVQKLFAAEMEGGMVEYEKNIATVKKELFAQISTSDTIADVGIGTGPNFKFLPPGASVIGVDPNKFMWPYAAEKAHTYGIDLRLVGGVCENLPLDDKSCDIVITTLTLCSVQDAEAAVREIIRVLKPGGKHLFIEHVVASPRQHWLRLGQNLLNPLQVTFANGCHLNRDTGRLLQRINNPGYDEVHMRRFDVRSSGMIGWLNPIGPHIAGYGQKAHH